MHQNDTTLPDGDYSATVHTGPTTCAAHLITVQGGRLTRVNYDGQQISSSNTCFRSYVIRAVRAIEMQQLRQAA